MSAVAPIVFHDSPFRSMESTARQSRSRATTFQMDIECYPRDARRVSLGPASYTFDTRARFLATPADEFEPAIAEQWENNKAQLRQQLAN